MHPRDNNWVRLVDAEGQSRAKADFKLLGCIKSSFTKRFPGSLGFDELLSQELVIAQHTLAFTDLLQSGATLDSPLG